MQHSNIIIQKEQRVVFCAGSWVIVRISRLCQSATHCFSSVGYD